jgi:IS30 family transposase
MKKTLQVSKSGDPLPHIAPRRGMGKKNKWTDDDLTNLVRWKDAGVTVPESAKLLNVAEDTIKRKRALGKKILNLPNAPRKPSNPSTKAFASQNSDRAIPMGRPPKVTDADAIKIVLLQDSGISIGETASKLKIAETTVKRARRRGRILLQQREADRLADR